MGCFSVAIEKGPIRLKIIWFIFKLTKYDLTVSIQCIPHVSKIDASTTIKHIPISECRCSTLKCTLADVDRFNVNSIQTENFLLLLLDNSCMAYKFLDSFEMRLMVSICFFSSLLSEFTFSIWSTVGAALSIVQIVNFQSQIHR